MLTTKKVFDEGTTMTTKISATMPLFQKKNGANGSLNHVISSQQLLRTRNQMKKTTGMNTMIIKFRIPNGILDILGCSLIYFISLLCHYDH